jgi:hypothetical protein
MPYLFGLTLLYGISRGYFKEYGIFKTFLMTSTIFFLVMISTIIVFLILNNLIYKNKALRLKMLISCVIATIIIIFVLGKILS